MNDFAYIAAVRQSNGATGIEVAWEFDNGIFNGGLVSGTAFYALPNLADASTTDGIELSFDIDTATGIATPRWSYTVGGVSFDSDDYAGTIERVTLQGAAINALNGENMLDTRSGGTVDSALSVGVVASNSSSSGAAAGDVVAAINAGGPTVSGLVDGQTVTFLTDASGVAAGWKTGTSAVATAAATNFQGTELDALHAQERYGKSWGYDIPVANGVYQVDLYFAEIYWGAPGGGSAGGNDSRRFQALLEGAIVDVRGLRRTMSSTSSNSRRGPTRNMS